MVVRISENSRLGLDVMLGQDVMAGAAVSAIIRRGTTPVSGVPVAAIDKERGGAISEPLKTDERGIVVFNVDIPGRKIILRPIPSEGKGFSPAYHEVVSLSLKSPNPKYQWDITKSAPFAVIDEPTLGTKITQTLSNPWVLGGLALGAYLLWLHFGNHQD